MNKVNPSGQTRDEYLEKKRQYRIDNKDKIQEYIDMRKQKVNCECSGSYTLNNKTHHLKTKKHILFLKMDLEKMV